MEIINTTRKISEDLMNAGYKVALNQMNSLGLKTFHCKGVGNSVPDILFWNPEYENRIFDPNYIPNKINSINAGFIETKTGNHLKEIANGRNQLIRYYGYFITNEAKFSIEGNRIYNVDVFLLGTNWSRTGMIYKGDEQQQPKHINFMSERYNALFLPYTLSSHSNIRADQKKKRMHLRNKKINIPANKVNTETGLMISKIPIAQDENISYDYFALIGNKMMRMSVHERDHGEYIETSLKLIWKTQKALLFETPIEKKIWIPKSIIDVKETISIGNQININIPRWLYMENRSNFGIA